MTKHRAQSVDRHVGGMIRKYRVDRGLTQSDLARAAGLSYQQVQKYEAGSNRVSAGKLYEFAVLLKVAPEAFFEGLPAPARPAGGGDGAGPVTELARNFERVENPGLRAAVASVVKHLASDRPRRPRA
jgi:transcriptional regulator with XRE-family HTH domain